MLKYSVSLKFSYLVLFPILLLISFYSTNVFSQWVRQFPGVNTVLYDIEFINDKTGWACGDGGKIIKTTNGGTNWFLQNPGVPNKLLHGIHPVDSNIIYSAGFSETIIKSTDGGNSWIHIRNGAFGTGRAYNELFFLNQNTGWFCFTGGGGGYYVLRTTDGGNNFDSSYVFWGDLNDIYFKDSINGIMCGNGYGFFKTTNSGINWFRIYLPFNQGLPDFKKFSVVGNTCWLIGNYTGKILISSDFGNTWDTTRMNYNSYISTVFFTSLLTGWCMGQNLYTYGSQIFKSTNGGYNWLEQIVPVDTGGIASCYFVNDSIGWACGVEAPGFTGLVFHTTNGGTYVSISKTNHNIPAEFILHQNYPNPFNSETIIEIDINKEDNYVIEIFNAIGESSDILINRTLKPGKYTIKYKADKLTSGIYYYRIKSSEYIEIKKFVLIK